ncbi:MAG: transglycosylase SLT domain-containing protein [Pseudomonadota bacterium]
MLTRSTFLALCLFSAAIAGCATSPPDKIGDACEIFDEKRSWYRATHKAQKRYGVPKALQLAIIRQESSFHQDAKPPRGKFLFVFPGKRLSSARGYPQALEGTWEAYKADTGDRGANRKNFKDATNFVAWYVDRTHKKTGVPKDDPYRQYLAYHEGADGYLRGTYTQKAQVKESAQRVEWVYRTYASQLSRCEKRFRRGIPLIPGI